VSAHTGSRRGALLIGAAKGWFLVVGLAQNVLLPWAIGQDGFGAYRRALVFVNVLNNVVVAASIQSVSRVVAEADPRDRPAVLRRALGIHAPLGLLLALGLALATPAICAFQRAPQLAWPLYALALVPLLYGVYAPLVGALNGARLFGRQAALDGTFSTLRTGLTAAVGWLFLDIVWGPTDGALGASVGFVLAAMLIVPIALGVAPVRGAGEGRFDRKLYFGVLGGLVIMQLLQSLTFQVDLAALGRAATLASLERGVADVDARRTADALSGLYAQAQSFGFVPYQLLTTASFVLFPSIAEARARGDDAAGRQGVERGGRATAIVAGALAAAIGGAPVAVLRFAFGRGGAYAVVDAAPALRALAVGHAGTALFALGGSLLVAGGRARLATALAGVGALLAIVGTFVPAALVREATPRLGTSVAIGLAVAMALAATIVAQAVRREIGPFLRLIPSLRVALALGAALLAGAWLPIPSSRLLCAAPPFVPLIVYLVVVSLLGEPVRALLGRARS
jgi:stage V sporulation protein B